MTTASSQSTSSHAAHSRPSGPASVVTSAAAGNQDLLRKADAICFAAEQMVSHLENLKKDLEGLGSRKDLLSLGSEVAASLLSAKTELSYHSRLAESGSLQQAMCAEWTVGAVLQTLEIELNAANQDENVSPMRLCMLAQSGLQTLLVACQALRSIFEHSDPAAPTPTPAVGSKQAVSGPQTPFPQPDFDGPHTRSPASALSARLVKQHAKIGLGGGMNSRCFFSPQADQAEARHSNRRDLDHTSVDGRLAFADGALRQLGVLHEGEPPSWGRAKKRSKWTTREVEVPAYASRGGATSSGSLYRSTVCRRRDLTAPLRNLYFEILTKIHNELRDPVSKSDPDKRPIIASLLDDLDAEMLRLVAMDSRVQRYSIRSKKKVREDVLREIKQDVKERRNNPLHILQCAVDYARQSGTSKAFSGVRSMCGKLHTAPSADEMASAKRLLWLLAMDDLEVMPTDDGFFVNLRAACEMEALRLLQTEGLKDRLHSGTRSVGLAENVRWQDLWHVKITLDARRVTKKNCQTEVMMIFIPKGRTGVDRCQSAVHIRTIAVWAGKDSKANVQKNFIPILAGISDLEQNGILYSPQADTFLGVHELYKNKGIDETKPLGLRRAKLEFWLPADMLAQSAVIGHGCAGDQFCSHCHVTKDDRHLPFQLVRLARETNFQALAEEYDLFPATLHRINLPGHAGEGEGDCWALTEEGLRACTQVWDGETSPGSAPAHLSDGSESGADSSGESRENNGARSGKRGRDGCVEGGVTKHHRAARSIPVQPNRASDLAPVPLPPADGSILRKSKAGPKSTKQAAISNGAPLAPKAGGGRMRPDKGAKAAEAAAAAAVVAARRRVQGPQPALFRNLRGWQLNHLPSCRCHQCLLPADTLVRIIPNHGFCRESDFLKQHWPNSRRDHFPFCALHCLMRITEGLFFNICQFALKSGEPTIQRLNKSLKAIGMSEKKQFKKEIDPSGGPSFYSKMTFLGTECRRLLEHDPAGPIKIEILLRSVWPSGDAGSTPDAVNFVGRSVKLWGKWAEVVELMLERDPSTLQRKNGFARFGKVCKEFVCMYQTMYHKEHCKSFYLHTLLHHAGDFMRALEGAGMCLGMMSNSGAERRHANGRAAFKRSLCGGCWRKQDQTLKDVPNLSAYLTLREIMVWQYGSDLLSHEHAVRAVKGGPQASDSSIIIQSRRSWAQQNGKAPLAEMCNGDSEPAAAVEAGAAAVDAGVVAGAAVDSESGGAACDQEDAGARQHDSDANVPSIEPQSAADVLKNSKVGGNCQGVMDLNEFVKTLKAKHLSEYVSAENRRCRESNGCGDSNSDKIGSWLERNDKTDFSCPEVEDGDVVEIEDVPFEGEASDPACAYVSTTGAKDSGTSGTYMPDWDPALWNGCPCDISEESGDGSEDRSTIAAWSEHSSEDEGGSDSDDVLFDQLPVMHSGQDEDSADDPSYDGYRDQMQGWMRRRAAGEANQSSESDLESAGPGCIKGRDITRDPHHWYGTRRNLPFLETSAQDAGDQPPASVGKRPGAGATRKLGVINVQLSSEAARHQSLSQGAMRDVLQRMPVVQEQPRQRSKRPRRGDVRLNRTKT